MPSLFIGVYVALYPYAAQTEQELSLAQGDLLYLLEKSTTDDWWKVKKRVLGSETEEPVGLVPNTYIQPAPVVSSVKAVYSYDRQTEEELSFQEDDSFDVYDTSDPDWLLVGRKSTSEYGFVPANYIDLSGGASSSAGATAAPAAAPAAPSGPSSFGQGPSNSAYVPPPPPPTFVPQQKQQQDKPLPEMPNRNDDTATSYSSSRQQPPQDDDYNEDDEDKPPLPSRPTRPENDAPDRRQRQPSSSSKKNEQFYNWYVQEVDGRKKFKATLSIGNGSIMYSSARTDSNPQQWPIDDLINYNSEKKHVFLELQHPPLSLDLHAGSKETAEEITSVLGDLSGANKAVGLREVIAAAKSAGQKMGKVLFDFTAQQDDEVSAKEGENIFIIDSERSREWWLIRNASGREGMIPSSYIEVAPEPTSSKRLSFYPSRSKSDGKKSKDSSSKRRPSMFSSSSKREREEKEEREREQERERQYQRQQDSRRQSSSQSSKSKPDSRKVRTWTDRSGAFKVDAAFVGFVDGKIHLHKVNGVKIAVAAGKMSVEDLEYVERITGSSLDEDKPLSEVKRNAASKQQSGVRRANTQRNDRSYSPPQKQVLSIPGGVSTGTHDPNGSHHDIPPATPSRPAEPVVSPTNVSANRHVSQAPSTQPDFDWFGFFLDCGVDINNCQRYAINFNRDQMDESILAEITPEVLRTLGLKEGDILRVTKRLDEKFNRRLDPQKTGNIVPVGTAAGGLFSNNDGTLKNNTTKAPNAPVQPLQNGAVGPSASTASLSSQQPPQPPAPQQPQSVAQGFDDDAWAIKAAIPTPAPAPPAPPAPVAIAAPPAPPHAAPVYPAASAQSSTISVNSVPPQPTGSLKEFLEFKPLQPVQTNAAKAANTSLLNQQTGSTSALPQQVQTQRTGGGSVLTIPVTIPISIQPIAPTVTGGMPLGAQATGGLVREPLDPFATGVAQQIPGTYNFASTMSAQATGNRPVVGAQFTGGFVQTQPTGGFIPTQSTGVFVQAQPTGGFVQVVPQVTGGFAAVPLVANPTTNPFVAAPQFMTSAPALTSMNPFVTGQPQVAPQTSFGVNPVNGSLPFTSFGQPVATGAVPLTSFGSLQPQVTTSSAPTLNALGNQMQQLNIQQQQPTNSFQAFPQVQPQPSLFSNSAPNIFQQQQSLQQPQQFGMAPTSFNSFPNGASTAQPLQTQPTGFGFGNSVQPQQPSTNIFQAMAPQKTGPPPNTSFGNMMQPLQATPTGGRRANLNAATPQNPFGF